MKKILFLIALFTLMGGVNSVKARDVYANLASGNNQNSATWAQVGETAAYTYGWTNTGEDYISLFAAFGGSTELDWSDGTSLNLNLTELGDNENNALAILIVADGKTFKRELHSVGSKTLTLTATSGDGFKRDGWAEYITANDLKHVTDIQLKAVNKYQKTLTESSATVSNVLVQISPKATLTFNASGVATVNLADIDVAGAVEYNATTHIVHASSNSGAFQINLNKADLRNVTRISLNATNSGTEEEITFSDILGSTQVQDNINGNLVTWSYSKWNYDFSSYNANASQVICIKFNVSGAGYMKINSITLTADAMQLSNPNSLKVAGPYAKWTNVTSSATIDEAATPAWNVGSATGTVYGDVNVNSLYYANLKDFKTMKIYVNASSATIRAMFNREADNGAFFNVQVNPSNGNLTEPSYSSYADGVFTIDLAKILADKETVHLNAIKAAAGQSNAYVDKVILEPITPNPYDYVLSGQYSSAVDISEFTSDASATAIDCSTLSGNNITITPSNPNCLFKARAGVLANNKNVIVGDACANLVLTDATPAISAVGYPFKAPVNFTATNVSYNRAYTENQASTVCLPFALSKEEAHAAGTFYTLTNYDGSTLTFTEIGAEEGTIAYKPYLFRAVEDGKRFNSYAAVNKPISTTGDLNVTVGSSETATMTGTLARQSVNGKYGWNSDDGVFSIAEDAAVTIDAFRAYISIPGESLARVATLFIDNTVTGINEVSNSEDIKGVKNFEGKVFENGKLVIFKKGMKFNAAGAQIK